MNKVTCRFITFMAPGTFVANEFSRDVDGPHNPGGVEWPDNAYSFRQFEREDVVDGEKRYRGTPVQVGPIYYHPDSKVETLEQVRFNPNANDILVRNMEGNGWPMIVWSRWGNWPQVFIAGSCCVLPKN